MMIGIGRVRSSVLRRRVASTPSIFGIARSGARGLNARRRSGRLTEDRLEDPVRLPDVLGPPPAGDEREDLFGLLARHRGRLVGPHVRQLTQGNLQRHRYVVEAVDGDRLLPALDLTDELAG